MRFTLLLLSLFLSQAHAQSYEYVTDDLDLSLRAGTSNRHKILQMVPSGDKVEVLERKDGYARIRTSRGTEGWMLDRHLMDNPSARQRVAAAEQEVARLTEENARLVAEIQNPGGEEGFVSPREAELEQQLAEIRRVASGALNLAEQNRTLKGELLQQGKEVQTLNQEVVTLKERSDQQWFLVGGIVVLVSIFLGHLLPRLRLRRGSNLDNF